MVIWLLLYYMRYFYNYPKENKLHETFGKQPFLLLIIFPVCLDILGN